MKKLILFLTLGILFIGNVSADHVGLGLYGSTYNADFSSPAAFAESVFRESTMKPGFFLDMREDEFGFNFDFGMMFSSEYHPLWTLSETWWLEMDYNFLFSYHMAPRRSPIDPFIGAGFGFGMIVDVTDYEAYGYWDDFSPHGDDGLRHFGFYGTISGGLNILLDLFFIEMKVDYHFLDMPLPIPRVDPYDSGLLRVMLGVGVLVD